jgi:hypothetical protein
MPTKLRQKTKKLFYKSYPFKVATLVKGGSLLKFWSIDYALSSAYLSSQSKDNLERVAKVILPYKAQGGKLRFEGDCITFFLKDRTQYETIHKELEEFIIGSWEPASDDETNMLLANNKLVIVDNLPFNTYTHKVIFKSLPRDKRSNLLLWLEKYPSGDIKISKSTLSYLNNDRYWKQDPFVLIKDPKMATMMSLIVGDHIRRIEQYVLRSSINTRSQD